MVRKLCLCVLTMGLVLSPAVSADSIEAELQELKSKIAELEQLKARVQELEQRVNEVPDEPRPPAEEELSLDEIVAAMRQEEPEPAPTPSPTLAAPSTGLHGGLQSFNPDISVIFNALYHNDTYGDGIGSIFDSIDGFEARDAQDFDKGFQIEEIELFIEAEIDPFFAGYVNFIFTEDNVELEEAVVRTTSLPYGLELKGGKFFSDFSRANWMHPHDWDFADRPLTSNLFFGEDGLNQTGVQVSWLAPTDFHLLLGAEFLQGDNDDMYQYFGPGDSDGVLSRHSGPRTMVQWAKYSPYLEGDHEAQIGVFHGYGRHQDEWDFAPDITGWTQGHSRFLGTDFVYKYDAPYAHGHGNVTLQGEYIYRKRDTDLRGYSGDGGPGDLSLLGNSRVDEQDGYYLQGIYGFAPQWRTGLRWEQVGLLNRSRVPNPQDERNKSHGNSRRLTAMVDFTPSDFARFRLQGSRGDYQIDGSREDVYQVMFQMIFSLGAHGAHKF